MKKSVETLFDNLSYTHKVHEKQCEVFSAASVAMRIISVVLLVVILLLQFSQLLTDGESTLLIRISVGLTLLEVGLAFFQLNFNFEKLLDQHRTTAKKALAIKNRLLIDKATITKAKLDQYVREINELYESAPQTGRIAKWITEKEQ